MRSLSFQSPTPSACQDLLQFLCAKDISHVTPAAGHVVETAMLNNRGGFEAVCSVLATDNHKWAIAYSVEEGGVFCCVEWRSNKSV